MGRELIFSHPQISALITSRFVAYAGDQWYLHRQKDAAGAFFWKVAQQGHNARLPEDVTRQGVYVAAADGKLLASDRFRADVPAFLALLNRSLERAGAPVPGAGAPAAAAPADPSFSRVPPAGGLILKSFTRIPLPAPEGGKWTPNQAVGRDHVWLTRDEVRSLRPAVWQKGARIAAPTPVAERLARFHLVDNVRGEPHMWQPEEIAELKLTLRVVDPARGQLALDGPVRLRSRDGKLGYEARLQGVVALDPQSGVITRFDLLSWGEAWGEGHFTPGAPSGRFPLLIAFSLAGSDPGSRVPPQGSRELAAYFGAGRQR